MRRTILDTSSVITLALAQQNTEIRARDSLAMHSEYGGLDLAIQAFILHEDIVFDSPSIKRNIEQLPALLDFYKLGSPLWEDDLTLERRVYESLLETHIPHMQKPDDAFGFFRMHTEKWMAAEVGAGFHYPSAGWRDIERELTPEGRLLANSLESLFGDQTPTWGAACATLLRTLYYDRLQQLASADLILHPLKGRFLGNIESDGSFTERGKEIGSNILSVFDQGARKAFYERKQKWLGRQDLTYQVPMLTSYVLNRCRSWRDLSKVIEEVRESKEARSFRESVSHLLVAADDHKNQEVDEILTAISAAAEYWTKSLSQPKLTKKIKISVPIIGVGLDVDVPDVKLNPSHGERVLVFIHMLMDGS